MRVVMLARYVLVNKIIIITRKIPTNLLVAVLDIKALCLWIKTCAISIYPPSQH